MPVLINEVVIRVDVTNQESGGASPPAQPVIDRQAIIEECVEKVLEVLKQKAER
ncbi:MAG: hypothetical protein HXX13_17515 [Bacteroidetes bacterium]|nr:hypothetical protein [Bacteroidota bacterium]